MVVSVHSGGQSTSSISKKYIPLAQKEYYEKSIIKTGGRHFSGDGENRKKD